MSRGRATWALAFVLVTSAGVANAQAAPDAPPADAPTTTQQPVTPVPATSPAPVSVTADTPGRPVDPDTAVKAAFANNPTFYVADLDVAQARQAVLAEEGRYPYVFQADAAHTRASTPRLGTNDNITTSRTRSYTVGTALRRTFPFGTSAEIRVEGERFDSDIQSSTIGATSVGAGYGVTARASVVQPLLRGAGRRIGEAELRAARDNQVISESSRVRAASELARDVLLAYWELWYSSESLRIERAALELARAQERQAKGQQASGALAPADVLTFSTRVAQLEESVVTAELNEEQRSLELMRLMGNTAETTSNLAAVTEPFHRALTTRPALQKALISSSIEIAELEAQARLTRTRAEVAGEATRPRFDLDGYVESQGVSERVPKAAERAGSLGWITAHVGATFELPLDDSRRQAEKQSALLAVRMADYNLKALRDRLSAQAAATLADERAAEQRLLLAQRTVAVSEEAYAAARGRFELGGAIALQVQQAEEDVRRARQRLARARVDLTQAQVSIEHLMGDLAVRYLPNKLRTK